MFPLQKRSPNTIKLVIFQFLLILQDLFHLKKKWLMQEMLDENVDITYEATSLTAVLENDASKNSEPNEDNAEE